MSNNSKKKPFQAHQVWEDMDGKLYSAYVPKKLSKGLKRQLARLDRTNKAEADRQRSMIGS
jgi:hypothetical protein